MLGLRVIAHSIAWLTVVATGLVLSAAAPTLFAIRVIDSNGTPVEAVHVRVLRSHDRREVVDRYTDINGYAAAEIGGIHKRLDVEVNGPPGRYRGEYSKCPSLGGEVGRNYEIEELCGLPRSRWANEASRGVLNVRLRSRLPSRAICRLTGRGSATRPYTYAGQDSAITLPTLTGEDDGTGEKLLWWFGDTVDDLDGWILVQNKLAASDPAADASRCLHLDYEASYASAALPVAADGVASDLDSDTVGPLQRRPLANGMTIEAEDTVWLDAPLVVPGPGHDDRAEKFGQSVFQPDAGDVLHVVYLSVRDMPELFRINHVGVASYSTCYPNCGDRARRVSRFQRLAVPLWFGPAERIRAPEGSALVEGDDYLIFKVPSRRTYCAAPPYKVDCVAGRRCDDGSRCEEPGKFCSKEPYSTCHHDGDCEHGACIAGGVSVMRVPRTRVLDKSAYRYWDARARNFVSNSARVPDAIVVDPELGNSVSIMWSTYLGRWLMISNYNRPFFSGQVEVGLRSAASLMGPWSDAQTIMQNVAGQMSYNPRFVPVYTKPAPADNLVYWTATFSSYGRGEPTYHLPFDYNVFLYETDLARLD